MLKTSIVLLGAGILAGALAAPQTARADNEGLAFVIGTAVGHALGDDGIRIRHVDRRHHRYGKDVRKFRWHQGHKSFHRKWQREHRREHRRDHRRDHRHWGFERRHDVREGRHGRRHDRDDGRRHRWIRRHH